MVPPTRCHAQVGVNTGVQELFNGACVAASNSNVKKCLAFGRGEVEVERLRTRVVDFLGVLGGDLTAGGEVGGADAADFAAEVAPRALRVRRGAAADAIAFVSASDAIVASPSSSGDCTRFAADSVLGAFEAIGGVLRRL